MIDLKKFEVWFVTGSQDLYGEETLKQVALLIAKKDSFYNYIGVDIANKTAGKLQRKLQAATEGRSASGNDYTEDKMPVANRNRSTGTVRFGR